LKKGGAVVPEEARAKIEERGRSCYAAWGGRARSLEKFFLGNRVAWSCQISGLVQVSVLAFLWSF